MDLERVTTRNQTKLPHLVKIEVAELLIFIAFIFYLSFLSVRDYYVFHSAAELFSSIIGFGIFIVALNTYKISRNDFVMVLGMGYGYVAILDIMHAFAYDDLNIFANGSTNMVVQFWITARFFSLCTLLVSSFYIHKDAKRPKYPILVVVYAAAFILAVLAIMYFRIFPTCYIDGKGLTQFKILSEYTIALGLCNIAFSFYKSRKLMDKRLFYYLEASIFLMVVYEILFTLFVVPTDATALTGHVIKVISFYCMYRAIIVTGLQRPFDILTHRLDNLREEEKQRIYMEEALSTNEQCYDLIINHSSDAIIIQSEGIIVFANSTSAKILGAKDPANLVGIKAETLMHKNSAAIIQQRIKAAIESKAKLPFIEVKLIGMDDRTVYVEGSSSYVLYKQKPSVLTMFRDISSKKIIEGLENDIKENQRKLGESKEFNRVLTEFFSNISHELKTPLNVLLGSIQLLMLQPAEGLPSPIERKLAKHLSVMRQNCYRLLRLVNNLIDLSKLDSGYMKLNLRNSNIVSIVEEITLSVADYVESKGVNIIFDTNVEEKIMAVDADKIERIMLNLLSNAAKFTNQGNEITVNIEDKQEKILISVEDTGIGIPEDKLKLIFDRFGQVDKTLARNKEGSGIGLSLVKSLVIMHGGSITVSSKLGEGSKFIMELPVLIVGEEANAAQNQAYQNNVERISIEFSDIYN